LGWLGSVDNVAISDTIAAKLGGTAAFTGNTWQDKEREKEIPKKQQSKLSNSSCGHVCSKQ